MPTLDDLLARLWDDYARLNPQALAIHRLLEERGETIFNDHIAFRTFDDPRVSLDKLARPFVELGYEQEQRYEFPEKKLTAYHYEHAEGDARPKIFVSQLQLNEFSGEVAGVVRGLIDQMPFTAVTQWDFPVMGRPWQVSYADYERLRGESEYAAWVAAFGFRANHFTIDVGRLKKFPGGVAEFNDFIKAQGYALNTAGGEIKGSPRDLLEQSSTLAEETPVEFADGTHRIPACYYEFARRYPMSDGRLFQGFVARSADKIFESTDRR